MTLAAWEAIAVNDEPDQAWLDTVALLVFDAATGATTSEDLSTLRREIADKVMSVRAVSADLASQLRLLVVQLDAASQRRAAAEKLADDQGRHRAQVIGALRKAGGTAFTDELLSATGLAERHLSPVCRELLEAGVLLRRAYGKRVEWTLTPLAEEALTEPLTKAPPSHRPNYKGFLRARKASKKAVKPRPGLIDLAEPRTGRLYSDKTVSFRKSLTTRDSPLPGKPSTGLIGDVPWGGGVSGKVVVDVGEPSCDGQ